MTAPTVGAPPRRASLIAPSLFALAVFTVLVSLGIWQLERLTWKEDLLARIDARIHAAPNPLPASGDWPAIAAGDYEYTHVRATGRFEPAATTFIRRASGKVEGQMVQPGYWVMTPLRLADGAAILVNRGFISLDDKDDARATAVDPGDVAVTGLLRAPEPRNMFTPADDPAKGQWYTRDPQAIAAALNIANAAPFSIDEDAHRASPGAPAGGATTLDIPNDHLSYAVTWFGLAATLVGVFGLFLWRRARGR